MSDQTLIRFLRFSAGLGAALALIGSGAIIADGHGAALWSELIVAFVVFSVFFALAVWVVVPRQPRNPVAWAMATSAFFSGLWVAGLAAASRTVDDAKPILQGAEHLVPADLPASAAWIIFFTEPAIFLAMFPMLTFGLLMFPDGTLPSPRWRGVGMLAGVSLVVVTVLYAWGLRPASTKPTESQSLLLDIAFIPLVLAIILSLVALLVRYRRSSGTSRQQFKWVAWGASLYVPTMVVVVSLGGTRHEDLIPIPFLGATSVFLISYGIAVGKYRLYDVDVVISKSVTYLSLGAIITVIFGAVVAGPLLVIGQFDDGDPGLGLPIVATAVVAMVFEPVRSRLQRWANRLVYGERSTPHEVLSQLIMRLSETSPDSGTSALARLLAEGTAAEQAVVWLQSGDTLVPAGTWPTDSSPEIPPVLATDMADDEFTVVSLVRHGNDHLGALSLTKPGNDPVTPAERELVADVAAGAGLMLRNITLNRQLEERARQVRESRLRLIATQDAERHRLERDLHDGAQQQVVALRVKLGIAKTIAEREGADDVVSLISALSNDTQDAVDALRAVAHGIYPPLLEAEGLEVALQAQERTSEGPLVIETNGLTRYTRPVEETVYFCVLDAMERARTAGASSVSVKVTDTDGELIIEIEHDGQITEADLTAMSDRVDAFAGTTTIEAPPGDLSRITSRIPASESTLEPA